MDLTNLLMALGSEIEDHEEEAFLLFSQSIPSQNLGFVDARASELDITIGDRDLTIRQSPTILSSNRDGGTTGAVVWKITPLFATWLSSPSNLLFKYGVLHSDATILELGCGISGIIGITMGTLVAKYVLTDQQYVMKLLNENLTMNTQQSKTVSKTRKATSKTAKKDSTSTDTSQNPSSVVAKVLDWEEDVVTNTLVGIDGKSSFDVVVACDCIYNDALIDPLVNTCVDVAKLATSVKGQNPTLIVVAQQLRSPEVFEGWLKAFHCHFRVWRVPDEQLVDGLKSHSGFVVHIGILR